MVAALRKSQSGPRVEYLITGEYQILGLPSLSPTFHSRQEAEDWLRAELPKISPARQPRERACLRCGQAFTSEGFHNRMCNPCRHFSDAGAMGIATRATGQVRRAARY